MRSTYYSGVCTKPGTYYVSSTVLISEYKCLYSLNSAVAEDTKCPCTLLIANICANTCIKHQQTEYYTKLYPDVLLSTNIATKAGCIPWNVVPTVLLLEPLLIPMLVAAQTSTSYLVPGLSTGVVYCLCVAVLFTVLLQPPGGPLDGLSRYLSR